MNRGGRPRNSVWEDFCFVLRKQNGKNVAFCPGCNRILTNTAEERLKNHRKKCGIEKILTVEDGLFNMEVDTSLSLNKSNLSRDTNVSIDISEEILPDNNNIIHPILLSNVSNGEISKKNPSVASSTTFSNSHLKIVPKKLQRSMQSFLDKISEKERELIDQALANLIFSCNIDFDIVDSKYFKEFIKLLRPAYIPPDSGYVASKLLQNTYDMFENTRNDINVEFGTKPIILFLNQTIYLEKVSILAMIRAADEEHLHFLKIFSLSLEERETEFREIVNEAMELTRNKFSGNVFAIVTEEISLLDSFTFDKWITPCNIKIANLIATSLANHSVCYSVQTIVTTFQKRGVIELDKEIIDESISAQSNEVWRNHLHTYSTYLNNLTTLKQKVAEGSIKLNQKSTTLVFDESFNKQIEELKNMYMSLIEIIDNFEKSTVLIGDAIQSWLDLLKCAPEKLRSEIELHINSLKQPVSITANLLHPIHNGKSFSPTEMKMAKDFLFDNLEEEGLSDFTDYVNKKGIFAKLFKKNIKSPVLFWQLVEEETPNLSKLALKISSIPASSIKINGHFLEKKNLPNEQSDKIVNLYYNLKIQEMKK
ncbi:uncharacterized protein LOC127278481 [Leptopilina boulardi]|uniref:uncharacterized protein LOC127278481 n=1 Tax=Leptopilina boulardi TaxID=63433 RepID=UPI0021F64BA8|nr:uncharacterized protein LOC127278481 [Leptopilina boulardi]